MKLRQYGETVRFNKHWKTEFDPNHIGHMQVYNLSVKSFTNCECWVTAEGDNPACGMIADFSFEVSKTHTRLFFGDTPSYGFMTDLPQLLIMLPVGLSNPKGFVRLGSFNLELRFPAPKTMEDMTRYIDRFIADRVSKFQKMKNEHYNTLLKEAADRKEAKPYEPYEPGEDDLPF